MSTDWLERLPPVRPSRWRPGAWAEYAEARDAWFAANRRTDALYDWYLRNDVSDEQEAVVFQVLGLFDRFAAALMLETVLLWETGSI